MRTGVDHVALCVNEFDWYVNFFEEMFHMQVRKSTGEKPERKVWFDQGIQLNEVSTPAVPGRFYHHIGIRVIDPAIICTRLLKNGGVPYEGHPNWFLIRDELLLEILQ